MRAAAVALLCSVAIAGCGSSSSSGSALVDPDRFPQINALEQDPQGDGFLLTTNRGLYRIADGEATRVASTVDTPDGSSPVGRFLALARAGTGGGLIGSGHPDKKGRVAGFLGLMRSADDGRTWDLVSRYGIADLHAMRVLEGTLYAYDAVLPAVIVSPDGGKTWDERSAPPGRVFDFVVDPENPDQLLASTKRAIYRSTDGGHTWSATTQAQGASLAWPAGDSLFRADEDGNVYSSDNQGATWDLVGRIDGDPRALISVGPDELYAALADAAIVHSTDAGESWEEYFTP